MMIDRLPADLVVMDAVTADRLLILAGYGLDEARRIYGGVIPPDFAAAVQRLDRLVGVLAEEMAAKSGTPDTAAPSESFVSVETAADRLGRAPRTVRAWLIEGKLAGRRVGRQWLVETRSIDQHLEDSDGAA